MNIAVIPARGGSKRIPRKNIRQFRDRPMIAWPIAAAIDSGCFDRIIVSTDDDEIAAIAQAHGAEVPFRRPAELSDDHTPTIPVVAHAVRWVQQRADVERACCIYATAPMLRAEDLRAGLTVLDTGNADYAFSVTSYPFPIQRAVRIDSGGHVSMFQPDHWETRSQDLEEAFHDAGQFYWGRAAAWLTGKPIFDGVSTAVRLPRKHVQDIDTIEDWEHAELLFGTMAERSRNGESSGI